MNETEQIVRETLTPDEVFKALGCGRNRGYALIAEHNLGVRIGRRIVVPKSRLKRFLDGNAKAT